MKKSAMFIKNRIEAIAGRFILVVYRTYSAVFIKKEGFTPPHTPIRRQEIILLKRTGHTYRIAAKEYHGQTKF